MQPHEHIDLRALRMDRLIAAKIREQPELVDRARDVLARWKPTGPPDVQPTLDEWSAILEQPLDDILAVLESADARATRLRQSSPFCGILTREERTRILLDWESQRRRCEPNPT